MGDAELDAFLHQPGEPITVARADREHELAAARLADRGVRSPPAHCFPAPRPAVPSPPARPVQNLHRSPSGPANPEVMDLVLVQARCPPPATRAASAPSSRTLGRHPPPSRVQRFLALGEACRSERRAKLVGLGLLHAGEDRQAAGPKRRR